jgi:hypothetical protein
VRHQEGKPPEFLPDQVSGVRNGSFWLNGPVSLDLQRQAIKVRPLPNPCLFDREIRPTNRVVDRIDSDKVDRRATRDCVRVRQYKATARVHMKLHMERTILLEREQVVVRIHDLRASRRLDHRSGYRTTLFDVNLQHGFLNVIVERYDE